jgi:hypothetical protein
MNQLVPVPSPPAMEPIVHYRLPRPKGNIGYLPVDVTCARGCLIGILADLDRCNRAFVIRPDLPDRPLDPLSERLATNIAALTSLLGWPRGSKEVAGLAFAILDLQRELDFRGERQILASSRLPGPSRSGGEALVIAVAPVGIHACDLTFTA